VAFDMFIKYFALAFSALLPLLNPLGSAILFTSLVGPAPPAVYRSLARKIARNTLLFLVTIELVGAALLNFFGISLPVVQVAGGLVLGAMGFSLLNQKDTETAAPITTAEEAPALLLALEQKAFYPLTFPITAGPGCIVVMLTLSAHASSDIVVDDVMGHIGVFIAVVTLSILIYFSYAYAPRITRAISPQTAHGILRVIAFLLVSIGVQIAWNGIVALIATMPVRH